MGKLRDYGGWAIITGASAGLGEAFAWALAEEGYNCFLAARREDRLQALQEAIQKAHDVEVRYAVVDLSDEEALGGFIAQIQEVPVGVLVNNAGFGKTGLFWNGEPDRLAAMVRLNCLAPALLARACLPAMLERGQGAVIMVSSVLGFTPGPYGALYAATKAFDLSLGEALWGELRGTGVDVVSVCPGPVATEFFTVAGVDDSRQRRIMAVAAPPERIVRQTLRALGRRPSTGPLIALFATVMMRVFPRRWAIWIQGRIMRESYGVE